jgi:hypothetical protein
MAQLLVVNSISLELTNSVTRTTGVIIATYRDPGARGGSV